MNEDLIPRIYSHVRRKAKRSSFDYDPTKLIDRIILYSESKEIRIELISMKISILRNCHHIERIYEEILKYIKEDPLRPETWIMLVTHFREDLNDLSRSIEACNICISLSKIDGNFRIQCLREKLFTSLHFNEKEHAIDCIQELISLRFDPSAIDEFHNLDFLEHPRAPIIPRQIVEAYIEHVKSLASVR